MAAASPRGLSRKWPTIPSSSRRTWGPDGASGARARGGRLRRGHRHPRQHHARGEARLHPRRGSISFDGRPINALAPFEIKRLGISYVPQGANIFPQLTVEENLQLGGWVIRRDGARVAERLESAYAAFPRLREKRRRRATTLSGGEAKMLSLAKELVTEPTLLLVDEPSAGLAPRIVEQVYAQLLAVRDQGVTILLVDQNINKAVQVSDYLYMIERGEVRRQGTRHDFADQLHAIVRDALLGA